MERKGNGEKAKEKIRLLGKGREVDIERERIKHCEMKYPIK